MRTTSPSSDLSLSALLLVFSVLSVSDRISGEQFLTIFSVVIAFYFGTQYQKGEQERQKGGEEE